MAAVARLLTLVDVDDEGTGGRQMSVSARHEAVLVDGRHILLLGDRGWSSAPLPAAEIQDDADWAQRPSNV
jgi:hypothetical protein